MFQHEIDEKEKLLQLAVMVLSEQEMWARSRRPLPFYLFSETSDNERSVFSVVERIPSVHRTAHFGSLAVIDDREGSNRGYPGSKIWIERLRSMWGMDKKVIHEIPCFEFLHTYSESKALVNYARENGWDELVIVAPPFHQTRAFISVVTAILKSGINNLRVYNQPGEALSWSEEVMHSQGTLRGTRKDFIVTESRRIPIYQEKGDLVSLDSVFDYLKWRNS